VNLLQGGGSPRPSIRQAHRDRRVSDRDGRRGSTARRSRSATALRLMTVGDYRRIGSFRALMGDMSI